MRLILKLEYGEKDNFEEDNLKGEPPLPAKAGFPLLGKRRGIVRAEIFYPVMMYFTAKIVFSTNFSSWQESLWRGGGGS